MPIQSHRFSQINSPNTVRVVAIPVAPSLADRVRSIGSNYPKAIVLSKLENLFQIMSLLKVSLKPSKKLTLFLMFRRVLCRPSIWIALILGHCSEYDKLDFCNIEIAGCLGDFFRITFDEDSRALPVPSLTNLVDQRYSSASCLERKESSPVLRKAVVYVYETF